MGMFDYVRSEYPLPGTQVEDTAILSNLQTKDLQDWPSMDTYFITENGELEVETYRVEDHSDPNAEGISRLIGMMTRIPTGREKVDFTGVIRFYGGNVCVVTGKESFTNAGQDQEWAEWEATFIHGKLEVETFRQVEYERKPARSSKEHWKEEQV